GGRLAIEVDVVESGVDGDGTNPERCVQPVAKARFCSGDDRIVRRPRGLRFRERAGWKGSGTAQSDGDSLCAQHGPDAHEADGETECPAGGSHGELRWRGRGGRGGLSMRSSGFGNNACPAKATIPVAACSIAATGIVSSA